MPYDLGLGVTPGGNVTISEFCLLETAGEHVNLFWQLWGADKRLLLIQFDKAIVVRKLDDIYLSTETHSDRWKGIDSSFARIIEGSEYPTDIEFVRLRCPKATHYAFITPSDCVDVIAEDRPKASLIDAEEIGDYRLRFPLLD
ncbi:hypothetical protein [Porphyrobacter sp. AAP82]|uniref:hypothetical protein n=1 Tax=Porphyrobacter sp. AAP82 TaxID=1248917 RepID=UPI0012DE9FD0|nr:hypothetical protein [Porphyrobacter sp. AAP82]